MTGVSRVRIRFQSRSRSRSRDALASLVLVTAVVGCSEELGPALRVTTRVRGVVLAKGVPVTGGWIEFSPLGGTVGNLRSAPIGPDGSFRAEGVAVGKNLVGLVAIPGSGRAESRFFDTLGSPIRRTIPAGTETTIRVDLADEAAARPSRG